MVGLYGLIICYCIIHCSLAVPATLFKLESPGDAVCLDGTPPGYYHRAGSGSNVANWILHLEGGGWCANEENCLDRSKGSLGSSKSWPATSEFSGLLSDSPTTNPDFYNWNIVYIKYCDGASFAGDVDHPVDVQGTSIYFRGFKILQAILDDVLKKGLSEAKEVILTGCSAGGLATYLHADYVKSVLTSTVIYHAISDAGYFIDAPNTKGDYYIRGMYQYVFKMQNCTGGVNQDCINANSNGTWKCMMAQYTYPHISSPIFVLNSQYDTWQLGNILQVGCIPPKCTPEQMQQIDTFYEEFKQAAAPVIASQTNGAFLDSCTTHCQSLSDHSWSQIKVGGQTAAETFGNWYFKRSGSTKEIDCPYPCNKSC